MVCGSLQPGGAERQVANTLLGLVRCPNIESATLLCDYLHGGTTERYDFYLPLARSSGANIRSIKTAWSRDERECLPSKFKRAARRLHPGLAADIANLYREFVELRPEVVHAWLDWSNVRAGLAAALAGVPTVLLSGRNLSPRHFALNADYFQPAYKALLECSSTVTLLNNSQAGAHDYADWLAIRPERVRVLRNGVQFPTEARDLDAQRNAFRRRLGLPVNAPVVGGMFRFNPEKRPLLWLDAAAQVSRTLSGSHFVIFGQGAMQAEMETRVRRLGLTERVHFCGIVDPSFAGLLSCDVILLTSLGEGTPNVLLEAQWLGLPVVTTDAGGAGEAVQNGVTGLVVSSSDAPAIGNAVVTVLENYQFREQARTAGPTFVRCNYGMERMIQETLSLYRLERGLHLRQAGIGNEGIAR
jgi:glycosyltransferase involved in cell wall biosynthesis